MKVACKHEVGMAPLRRCTHLTPDIAFPFWLQLFNGLEDVTGIYPTWERMCLLFLKERLKEIGGYVTSI